MKKFLNNLSTNLAERHPKSYRVAKQVFREFWFPFVIAVGWAFYRVPLSQSDFIATFIAQLAASFAGQLPGRPGRLLIPRQRRSVKIDGALSEFADTLMLGACRGPSLGDRNGLRHVLVHQRVAFAHRRLSATAATCAGVATGSRATGRTAWGTDRPVERDRRHFNIVGILRHVDQAFMPA
jgi:hypothetical protein